MFTSSRRISGSLRAVHVVIGAALATSTLACSSGPDPMTADDIVERISAAQYEAATFRFEWEMQPIDDQPTLYEGAIAYDDDRQVEALLLRAWAADGSLVDETRFVDGTAWRISTGAQPRELSPDETEQLVGAWDWVRAVEDDDVVSVERIGDDEVDGTPVTGYEVVVNFESGEDEPNVTGTWWIDDQDLVRSTTTTTDQEDGLPRSRTSHYGEPVHIEPPPIIE